MHFDLQLVSSFLQVVMIDLVLAGDNAVVIGMAAAGVAPEMRRKAIVIGIAVATVTRIAFALVAARLLAITGLLLAGGLLLLWVAWKLFGELRATRRADLAARASGVAAGVTEVRHKSLRDAVVQIILADVSMSLDNVLAVAGAAQRHPAALVFGLMLSVALMGLASAGIAALLERQRWIAWAGLMVILYVALRMVHDGADEVLGPLVR